MRMPWRSALLILLVPHATWAGWASLGKMPAPTRDGQTLTCPSPQGVLALSVLSAEVVRLRFLPRPEFGRDHSYAVVGRLPGDSRATFDVQADRSLVRTSALHIAVRHRGARHA